MDFQKLFGLILIFSVYGFVLLLVLKNFRYLGVLSAFLILVYTIIMVPILVHYLGHPVLAEAHAVINKSADLSLALLIKVAIFLLLILLSQVGVLLLIGPRIARWHAKRRALPVRRKIS